MVRENGLKRDHVCLERFTRVDSRNLQNCFVERQ